MRFSKDGNMWCVLHGENLQEGICGFGRTRALAFLQFAWRYLNELFHVKL